MTVLGVGVDFWERVGGGGEGIGKKKTILGFLKDGVLWISGVTVFLIFLERVEWL